jgi:uncharacterized protein (TIGR02145 family)/uncharacterized repeat protein (TIGR02543 family)
MGLFNLYGRTILSASALCLASACLLLSGCVDNGKSGTLTDVRDGKTYKTVTIGNQTWMAENLNYLPQSGETGCYTSIGDSHDRMYGRLYDWYMAMTACPPGWHLPSRQEWDDLCKSAGGKKVYEWADGIAWHKAGKKLKAKSGWESYVHCGDEDVNNCRGNGNGSDKYGFSALPGGEWSLGEFPSSSCLAAVGSEGGWWTATEMGDRDAYNKVMYSGYDDVSEKSGISTGTNPTEKTVGRSVRCVMGEPVTYTLTLKAGIGGTVSGNPGTAEYRIGKKVNIRAASDSGYTFVNWTGGPFANAASVVTTVSVESNMTVTANFQRFVKPRVVHGAFSDPRDRKVYKTVTIGNTAWMAENLNYKTDSSWCYENTDSNCVEYGRLYLRWDAAKEACPPEWHLPSRKEWDGLCKSVGGEKFASPRYGTDYDTGWFGAGKKLKATSGWKSYVHCDDEDVKNCGEDDGNGTDDYGFSALPGGCRASTGKFLFKGNYGCWWTVDNSAHIFYASDYNDDIISETNSLSGDGGYSVRCIMDAAPNPPKEPSHENQ